jgi:murein DD-endopeptidase MepM/ murein hydrolase activator NlpD
MRCAALAVLAALLVPPAPLEFAAMFDAPETDWGAGHRGVDLRVAAGAEVRSPGAGIVVFAGRVAGRGVVVVRHESGLRSTLEPVTASTALGDVVVAGEVIGVLEGVGSHCAPATCLHWGVRHGDAYVDPLDHLDGFGPIRLLPLSE